MTYDYFTFSSHARLMASRFRFIDLFNVGESVMEKKLLCLKIGMGKKKICITAAENGIEHLGSQLLMTFLEQYADSLANGVPFFGYNTADIFGSVSLYALPMLNPDGVDIALHGLDITNPHHRRLISRAGIHSFSKVWQGNANGVDLTTDTTQPESSAFGDFIKHEQFDEVIEIKNSADTPFYDYNRPRPTKGFEVASVKSGICVELRAGEGNSARYSEFAKGILEKICPV